jgi:hypothetical protein
MLLYLLVFEKSVQILALAISELIGDRNFDSEGAVQCLLLLKGLCLTLRSIRNRNGLKITFVTLGNCESLLSAVANLMEGFDERQNAATEKFTCHLAGRSLLDNANLGERGINVK